MKVKIYRLTGRFQLLRDSLWLIWLSGPKTELILNSAMDWEMPRNSTPKALNCCASSVHSGSIKQSTLVQAMQVNLSDSCRNFPIGPSSWQTCGRTKMRITPMQSLCISICLKKKTFASASAKICQGTQSIPWHSHGPWTKTRSCGMLQPQKTRQMRRVVQPHQAKLLHSESAHSPHLLHLGPPRSSKRRKANLWESPSISYCTESAVAMNFESERPFGSIPLWQHVRKQSHSSILCCQPNKAIHCFLARLPSELSALLPNV